MFEPGAIERDEVDFPPLMVSFTGLKSGHGLLEPYSSSCASRTEVSGEMEASLDLERPSGEAD